MCRLFGMTSDGVRMRATFWLLDAPDSLVVQSRLQPDGTGLGWFDEHGDPHVDKQPVAAYEDELFAQEAREVCAQTFIAHIRYASTGPLRKRNSHPFEQHGRLFAHNGVVLDLPRLEDELGRYRDLVLGDTDSERVFALITRHVDRADGDVWTGIVNAMRWLAENVPVYALNFVLTTASGLWAMRYPDTHELYLLERHAGGPTGTRHLGLAGNEGRMRVHATDARDNPVAVVASDPMDESPHWDPLAPGELVHVGPNLQVRREVVLPDAPRHLLTLADLDAQAARSQLAATSVADA